MPRQPIINIREIIFIILKPTKFTDHARSSLAFGDASCHTEAIPSCALIAMTSLIYMPKLAMQTAWVELQHTFSLTIAFDCALQSCLHRHLQIRSQSGSCNIIVANMIYVFLFSTIGCGGEYRLTGQKWPPAEPVTVFISASGCIFCSRTFGMYNRCLLLPNSFETVC